MEGFDFSKLSGWGLFVIALLAWAGKSGIDALIKYRKDSRDGNQQNHDDEVSDFKIIITDLRARIVSVEADNKSVHAQLLEAIQVQGQLRGEVGMLRAESNQLRQESNMFRTEANQYRQEAEALRQEVAELRKAA